MFEKFPKFSPKKSEDKVKDNTKKGLAKVIAGGMAAGMIAGAAEQALAAKDAVSETRNQRPTEHKLQGSYARAEQERIESKLGGKLVMAKAETEKQSDKRYHELKGYITSMGMEHTEDVEVGAPKSALRGGGESVGIYMGGVHIGDVRRITPMPDGKYNFSKDEFQAEVKKLLDKHRGGIYELLDKWGIKIDGLTIKGVKFKDGSVHTLGFDDNTESVLVEQKDASTIWINIKNVDGTKDRVIIENGVASIMNNVK